MSGSNTTPTSSHSTVGSSPNSSTSGLEDIQYLLYLETLRRFRDDETNIKRQVEEKMRQYQEVKSEYEDLYAKYVSLVKLAATRCVLEQENHLNDSQIPATKANVAAIMQKLAAGNVMDYLDPAVVTECKEKLAACRTNDKLKNIKEQLVKNKAAAKAIQVASETVEATLETATVQGLNYFVEELQPKKLQEHLE